MRSTSALTDQNHNLVADNTDYTFTAAQRLDSNRQQHLSGCVWTATTCPSPALQGDLGNNTYINNIFVNNGNPGSGLIYAHPPIVFANCVSLTSDYFTTGIGNTMYPGNTPCLFNTADTYLPTSTFTNNLWFENGTFTDSNIIGYGPADNTGAKYTSHSQTTGSGYYALNCAGAAAVATVSGCLTGNPQFNNATPSLVLPNQFDLRLYPTSPAVGAATTSGIAQYDLLGTPYPSISPNLGAFQLTAGTLVSPGVATLPGFGILYGTGLH